jgi:hypothetical protein
MSDWKAILRHGSFAERGRSECKEAVFKPVEAALFAALVIAACAGIHALAVGAISI